MNTYDFEKNQLEELHNPDPTAYRRIYDKVMNQHFDNDVSVSYHESLSLLDDMTEKKFKPARSKEKRLFFSGLATLAAALLVTVGVTSAQNGIRAGGQIFALPFAGQVVSDEKKIESNEDVMTKEELEAILYADVEYKKFETSEDVMTKEELESGLTNPREGLGEEYDLADNDKHKLPGIENEGILFL